MATLTQVELSSIREMVASHRTTAVKLNDFAGQCSDPKIKQMFTQASTEANKSADNLMQKL